MISDTLFKIHGVTHKARIILWLIIATIAAFIIWSAFAQLDEVAIGEGKVITAKRGQVIQNLEGGILATMDVKEGQTVEEGQVLATLDPQKARAGLGEASARIVSLTARAARLTAEINDAEDIVFPDNIAAFKEVTEREQNLFQANRRAFKENVANLGTQFRIAEDQLKLARPLSKSGAASGIEILRLEQNVAELATRLAATRSQYYVMLRDEYARTMSELEPLEKIHDGLNDELRRTVIVSPTRGIVKDIQVTTIGGVVAPGGVLMEVVPIEDQLLIEARLNPRDIAFIHAGQEAKIKITAYDSGIYGSLPAKVADTSADTIEDDVDRRVHYYRAYILTEHNYLETKDGRRHPIRPGMVARAEIKTGRKSVLAYLIKPLNRAGEALRER